MPERCSVANRSGPQTTQEPKTHTKLISRNITSPPTTIRGLDLHLDKQLILLIYPSIETCNIVVIIYSSVVQGLQLYTRMSSTKT
jgi:hypothetical protein